MENDELLIKQVLNGNKNAFRIIVEMYKNYVFAVCMNIIKNPQDAENISQEVFIKIYGSLSEYEFKGFKAWIGKIAVRKSIDYKRKLQRINNNEVTYMDEIKEIHDNNQGIEEKLIAKYERNKLRNICKELPQKYSVVIDKYYMQDKSYKEIAVEEEISIKTVESRLYRAKKILRQRYSEG